MEERHPLPALVSKSTVGPTFPNHYKLTAPLLPDAGNGNELPGLTARNDLIDLFSVFHVSGANAFSILVEHIYAFLFAESTFVVPN